MQDIHYAAKDKGEKALSEVALQKARELDSENTLQSWS